MSQTNVTNLVAARKELSTEEEFLVEILKKIDEQLDKLQVEQLHLRNATMPRTHVAPTAQTFNMTTATPIELQTVVNKEELDLTVRHPIQHSEEEEEDEDECILP